MKITENVYVVPGVVANPYILTGPDGVVVIDTGMPGSEKKILAYVASLGKTAQDIKHIILTHSDFDHIGGLAALQKATGARTYASRIEADAIATGKPSRTIKPRGFSPTRFVFSLLRPFFKASPFTVSDILSDGQSLPICGELQVLETPGHTPGHISIFQPSTGVLFCGDSLVSDHGLQGSRPGVTWNEEEARASENRQSKLGARFVCSGHGPAVSEPIFPGAVQQG